MGPKHSIVSSRPEGAAWSPTVSYCTGQHLFRRVCWRVEVRKPVTLPAL